MPVSNNHTCKCSDSSFCGGPAATAEPPLLLLLLSGRLSRSSSIQNALLAHACRKWLPLETWRWLWSWWWSEQGCEERGLNTLAACGVSKAVKSGV